MSILVLYFTQNAKSIGLHILVIVDIVLWMVEVSEFPLRFRSPFFFCFFFLRIDSPSDTANQGLHCLSLIQQISDSSAGNTCSNFGHVC